MSIAAAAARPASPADAILGIVPQEVSTPATVAEAAAVLSEAARAKSRVAFVGGGTALGLGLPPRGLDVVLRTEKLDRVVEHAPSDQVISVEAGITLAGLQRTAAAHGQRLALDAPLAGSVTLGGLLATNGFGPLRTRYGTLRDLILGVTLVRADGTLARGGGKVVKNVAGFDLPKMAVGSLGTLGLIAAATFRLHPLPECVVTLLVPGRQAKAVRTLAAALREAQLEPAAVAAVLTNGRFDVAARFEGFRAGVEEQRDHLRALVAKEPGVSCDVLDEAEARVFWDRHDGVRTAGPLRAKIATRPTGFEDFFERSMGALLGSLDAPALVLYPTLGISFLSGTPADDLAAGAAIASARAALTSTGGFLVLEEAPKEVRARVDVWGSPPAALGLMKRLKDRLDPDALLNPGRFTGGI